MLEVRELTKYYGEQMAVEQISFTLQKGEIVGLLGHNGSGKTTTMRMITGCLQPTNGSVLLNGIPIEQNLQAAKRQIGYLPENPPLYPDMTVQEQLEFAAALRGISAAHQAEEIDLVCRQLQILPVKKRMIGNLSKGYRQRVGFAQGLIGHPELLVLDEPTVGLDPAQIMELREVIRTLGRDHAILLSSHILSEIAAVCGRILVLSTGQLVADDTPAGLVERISRQGRVLLRADGPQQAVADAIRSLPEVAVCDIRKNSVDGGPEYLITARDGIDCHKALFETMAAKGFAISVMQPLHANLEDVFLQLTQDRRYEEV